MSHNLERPDASSVKLTNVAALLEFLRTVEHQRLVTRDDETFDPDLDS